MSQNKVKNIVTKKNDDEKNTSGDNIDSTAVENLINQIHHLRSTIYKYEYELNLAKFGDIAESLPECTLNSACKKACRIPDVQTILKTELYKFGGINCVKVGDEFVFQFPVMINGKETLYSAQVVNNNGRGDLGKWAMPESVDINEIVKEHPLDDINNVRNFIKTCKHYIDCYTYRQQQFFELMDYVSDSKNYNVETNMEYTRIVLQILGIKMIGSAQLYDIVLYLFYKPNEAMPCQMKIETRDDEDELDKDMKKMFQKYFKYFKKHNLKLAFVKIESNTSVFEMKKIPKEDINVIDLEEEDDELAVEFFKIIRKKNGGKVNAKKNQLRDVSREIHFSDEDEDIGDESELAGPSQGVSKSLTKPKRNKTSAKRNFENGKTDKVKGIPKKSADKAKGKRKSLGEKQQTLDFMKNSNTTQNISNQTVSNLQRTVHVNEHVTDEMWEANNNASPQMPKKSVAMKDGVSAIVENPTTKDTSQKKTKNVNENKKRKSVRWQVNSVDQTNRQTVHQNTAEGSITLMNSTPLSEALRNCRDIRPSFDDMSAIVKNDQIQRANKVQQDAEENSGGSDSGESEGTEDRATLLRDLQLVREMKDLKSKKKVPGNKGEARVKKNIKMKKR